MSQESILEDEAVKNTEIVSNRKDRGGVNARELVEILEYSASYPNGETRRLILNDDGDVYVFGSGPLTEATGAEGVDYHTDISEVNEMFEESFYLQDLDGEYEKLDEIIGFLDNKYVFS